MRSLSCQWMFSPIEEINRCVSDMKFYTIFVEVVDKFENVQNIRVKIKI